MGPPPRQVDSIIAEGYYFLSAEKISLFAVDELRQELWLAMSLFAVDELRQELWLAVSDDAAGVRVPIAKGIVGKVPLPSEKGTVHLNDTQEALRSAIT
ncbi:hypothetical protein T484DRAFT_1817762 [Baffinella frigidus]|nr:hypothetical protein T484DRAFT_1817762 [Cryptophyta sp. CCMP2293]